MKSRERTVAYYDHTAGEYDALHGGKRDIEHLLAIDRAIPLLETLEIQSVLEVGCGSGRTLEHIRSFYPEARLTGVDPSDGLLATARTRVPNATFSRSFGEELPFGDGAVDLAVATGVMHHADRPRDVIREMFRVASKAVVISDHNNFSFGGHLMRRVRLGLYACGLMKAATFVKQGFRSQGYSKDDGWWYPYSLFEDFGLIASLSSVQYVVPTRRVNTTAMSNILLVQSHFAVVAIKGANTGEQQAGRSGAATSAAGGP